MRFLSRKWKGLAERPEAGCTQGAGVVRTSVPTKLRADKPMTPIFTGYRSGGHARWHGKLRRRSKASRRNRSPRCVLRWHRRPAATPPGPRPTIRPTFQSVAAPKPRRCRSGSGCGALSRSEPSADLLAGGARCRRPVRCPQNCSRPMSAACSARPVSARPDAIILRSHPWASDLDIPYPR